MPAGLNDVQGKADDDYAGHRSRLLSRFEDHGLTSFKDYEIVELILTFAIPRIDTKPAAKELLRRHKTLGRLLHVNEPELMEVKGVGKKASLLLRLFREVTAYCLQEKYEKRPIVLHRKDVEEYLRFTFGFRGDEYIAALYLDNGNNIIGTDIVGEGTVNQCAVYPRSIIEKALRYKAASMIIAHNHPGGSMNPSNEDWVMTEQLAAIGKLLQMPLLDHVIVCREKTVSLRDFSRWPQ